MITTHTSPLVDLHVNGLTVPGLRDSRPEVVDFSSSGLTLDYVRRATERLVQLGTDVFLATVVTGELDHMLHSVSVLSRAMEEPWGSPILGIHLEGSFLSPECKGAHAAAHIVNRADTGMFDRLFDTARERIVLATVSPAIDGAPRLIEHMVERGVVVSLGHHNAGTSAIEEAFAAGATGLTHAGNAWFKHAPANYPKNTEVLAQLAADGAYVMVIPDGVHVPPDFIKYVARIVEGLRPVHMVWVSDRSPVAGAPEGEYTVYNHLKVRVERAPGGSLCGVPLSGSSLTLPGCIEVLERTADVPADVIIKGATTNPIDFVEPALVRVERFPSTANADQSA
jgi:N-acetylglucosamine-6-phosphate deacetylase